MVTAVVLQQHCLWGPTAASNCSTASRLCALAAAEWMSIAYMVARPERQHAAAVQSHVAGMGTALAAAGLVLPAVLSSAVLGSATAALYASPLAKAEVPEGLLKSAQCPAPHMRAACPAGTRLSRRQLTARH